MSLIEKWWKSRKSVSVSEENTADTAPAENAAEETANVPAPEASEATEAAVPAETAESAETAETAVPAEFAESAETAEEASAVDHAIEIAEETVEITVEDAEEAAVEVSETSKSILKSIEDRAEKAAGVIDNYIDQVVEEAGLAAEAIHTAVHDIPEPAPGTEDDIKANMDETIDKANNSVESIVGKASRAIDKVMAETVVEVEKIVEESGKSTAEILEEEAEAAEAAAAEAKAVETAALADTVEAVAEEIVEQDLLDTLEPADVFGYFKEIAAIPHGSYNTRAISDYLEEFAKNNDLPYVRDEMGNFIICRAGSEGYEDAAPVALQGHIDMVCEKESSNPIDMDTEAITLQTDGEWLWADRTTLGGDDGIAVAIMLALLADDSITCPPLECIFTVDEEVGMLGAGEMDLSSLKSRRMINLDSEKEGIITAACAGGAEKICALPGKRREKKGEVLEISIEGLHGGHSGECIGMGRANADILMARLLYRLEQEGKYCLINFHGGNRDNAIPREAKADIIFTGSVQRSLVKDTISFFAKEIEGEYSVTDPNIHVRAKWPNKGKKESRIAFIRKDTRKMVRFLMTLPNGVLEYFPMDKDAPQTSLNLGIVNTVADGMRAHTLIRSNVNSQKQMVMGKIDCLADQFGASVSTEGSYPAWELIAKSDFRDLAAQVYEEVSGSAPTICVIHAGLECGLLAAKVPGLDCISVGPDMEGIHTPGERLNIASSRRTYDYVKALLEACAKV